MHYAGEACVNAAKDTYAEMNATNAPFKKIHAAMMAFRADAYLGWQVAEYGFDTYMIRARSFAQGSTGAYALTVERRN